MFTWCCSSACKDLASQTLDLPKFEQSSAKNALDEVNEEFTPTLAVASAAKAHATASASGAKALATAPTVVPVEVEREPEPGAEFTIQVSREPGDSIGMDLDLIDGVTPLVVSTKAGTIQDWNDTHPKLMVKVGDKILDVNGVKGSTRQIISTLKEDGTWRIRLQRPRVLKLDISKIGKNSAPSLGLGLSYAKHGTSLLVGEVNEGPVLDWNLKNPEFQVQAQDRIVELNGTKGNAVELLKCSEGCEKLKMTVLHYPTLDESDSESELEPDEDGEGTDAN